MPLYGVAQAGSNVTSGLNLTTLGVGESLKLFDGTETPGAGVKSVAFSRGAGSGPVPGGGITFTIDFPSSSTDSLVIQAANQDVDADYQTIFTSTNNRHDNFTDTVFYEFYRAELVTYSGGGMPVVIAQR